METITTPEDEKWAAYYNDNLIGGRTPAYHVTPDEHFQSVLANGLTIRIGERSEMINELFPAIYLFPTLNDMEDALSGWLGDCFDDDVVLRVFEVDIQGLKLYSETTWEYISMSDIEPSRLTYLREE